MVQGMLLHIHALPIMVQARKFVPQAAYLEVGPWNSGFRRARTIQDGQGVQIMVQVQISWQVVFVPQAAFFNN